MRTGDDSPAWGQLSRALVVRAIACCVLATAVIQLLASTHLYATAVLLLGLAAATAYDLKRRIGRAEREVGRLLEGAGSPPSSFRTEQQLQYVEALLDTVSAALFVIREDGIPVLANRAARRLAGQSVSTLQQVDALGSTTANLLQSMRPGARHVAYLADGQPVYVSAAEFRGADNGKHRLISLQRIAGELDAVEVKAWQDVAAVLAHEMMNSLTPIASLSENLEQLLRDAQRTKATDLTVIELSGALEAIKRRSHGLMSFVERYRAVSELPEPDLQRVDLEQLLAGVDQLMSTMLQEAGVTYRRQVSPPAKIIVDPELIEQAVINLIRNAAEAATDAGAPCVTLTCELRDTELVIAVADNGRGLSEQQRDRIFIPFYTTKPDGSGIGLSLARQIAFAHGGRIEYQANSPRGSIFSIVLSEAGLQGEP